MKSFKTLYTKYDGQYPDNHLNYKFTLPETLYIYALYKGNIYNNGVLYKYHYRNCKDEFNRLMQLYYSDLLQDMVFIVNHWACITEVTLDTYNIYNKHKWKLVG